MQIHKSITVLGATSALLRIGDARIQLGASVITPGDVDAVLVHMASVEEMAALPAYMRRCKRNPKFNLYVPASDPVEIMLQSDTICRGFSNGSPLQIGIATYCNVLPYPMGALATHHGLRVRVERATWARKDDALSVRLFGWDPDSEFNDDIIKVLDESDADAAKIVDAEEARRTVIHQQAELDVNAGKKVELASLPGPLITNVLWAPYAADTISGSQHILFTQDRGPFDVTRSITHKTPPNTVITDNNIGTEYRL